ncbi:MAG: DUF3307 domain-containing protein [Pseudomonadota bacterium]
MIETIVLLLAAHLLADFPLQPAWLIERKRQLPYLTGHVLVVAITGGVLLGAVHWPLLLILVASHTLMDVVKLYLLPDTVTTFVLDQFVHLAVIVALAVAFPDAWRDGWWGLLETDQRQLALAAITLLSGLIAALQPGAILIAKATEGFSREIQADQQAEQIKGLRDGGRYIGYLERLLVLLFMVTHLPAGVGFLITAKSILRFGDVKESTQRKMTEYIIIGTFMSFGWGLLVAVLTQAGISHWLADVPPAASVPHGN